MLFGLLDFGIVLGCKFYIKEITNGTLTVLSNGPKLSIVRHALPILFAEKLAEKDPGLKEGDIVLKVNGQSLDGVTLDGMLPIAEIVSHAFL